MVHSEIGASWSVLRFDHSIYQFREPATKLSIKDNFDVRALTHSRVKLVSLRLWQIRPAGASSRSYEPARGQSAPSLRGCR